MVINHKYKYLFVELPYTGSTAIHRELREFYGGEPIIRKHATYPEFLQQATADEKKYFVFSGIRNPLDVVVSDYFKIKTNHENAYTTPIKYRRNGGFVTDKDLEKYRYLNETNADFPTFFLKYYRLPYDNWSSLSHRKFNYVIRFEQIQTGFAEVLQLLGIKQERDLPTKNPTKEKKRDFASYYSPRTYERARKVFGPFMMRWGYDFPVEWGENSASWYSDAAYNVLGYVRRSYWQQVRLNPLFLKARRLPKKENRQ